MFKRILIDDMVSLFTFISFLISFSLFLLFVWRALRMKKTQVSHFENLPFANENDSARHEP